MQASKDVSRTLRSQLWAGGTTPCSNPTCGRPMNRGDECFGDILADADYCQQCGIMLRYHRKKAGERGETLPITLNDVGKAHQ